MSARVLNIPYACSKNNANVHVALRLPKSGNIYFCKSAILMASPPIMFISVLPIRRIIDGMIISSSWHVVDHVIIMWLLCDIHVLGTGCVQWLFTEEGVPTLPSEHERICESCHKEYLRESSSKSIWQVMGSVLCSLVIYIFCVYYAAEETDDGS